MKTNKNASQIIAGIYGIKVIAMVALVQESALYPGQFHNELLMTEKEADEVKTELREISKKFKKMVAGTFPLVGTYGTMAVHVRDNLVCIVRKKLIIEDSSKNTSDSIAAVVSFPREKVSDIIHFLES